MGNLTRFPDLEKRQRKVRWEGKWGDLSQPTLPSYDLSFFLSLSTSLFVQQIIETQLLSRRCGR